MEMKGFKKYIGNRSGWLGFVLGVLLVLFAFKAVVFCGVYGRSWDGPFIYELASITRMPAMMVNFKPITYKRFLDDTYALSKFLSLQQDQSANFDKRAVRDIVREQFINFELLSDAMENYGLSISKDEIDGAIAIVTQQAGSKEKLELELARLYGWSLDEFVDKIIVYTLMEDKLSKFIGSDLSFPENKIALDEVTRLHARVTSGGEDFAEVAKVSSQDPGSTENGGDLGFFGRGAMVKEFEEAAFALEVGQVSPVIRSNYGYHIIKLEEKKASEGEVGEQLRARHILIRTLSFADFLDNLREDAIIWSMIPEPQNK